MNTELRKRLEEAAETFLQQHEMFDKGLRKNPYLFDGKEASETYVNGAEYGYKEAIAQAKEYLEENFSDIIFECICEYNKLKGSLNDDGTLCSDYRLAQDINILCQAKFIHELFKED